MEDFGIAIGLVEGDRFDRRAEIERKGLHPKVHVFECDLGTWRQFADENRIAEEIDEEIEDNKKGETGINETFESVGI
jgi:hypothetical protein